MNHLLQFLNGETNFSGYLQARRVDEAKSPANQSRKQQIAIILKLKGGHNYMSSASHPQAVTVKGGKFYQKGQEVKNAALKKHLESLRVPKGWKNIVINPTPGAKLVAVGTASNGRIQYHYAAANHETNAVAKFSRVKSFAGIVPRIRETVANDLRSKDPQTRQNAIITHLIDKTYIRPMTDADTRAKVKAYGATTLESRHVTISGDTVTLRFVGKKGVPANIKVTDSTLARNLAAQQVGKKPEDRLFPDTNYQSHYKYLAPFGYTAKDFRTHHATRIALEVVKTELPKLKGSKDINKLKDIRDKVLNTVSSALNNTPQVARNAYIDWSIWAPLEKLGLKP